jgi:hypothetical protein
MLARVNACKSLFNPRAAWSAVSCKFIPVPFTGLAMPWHPYWLFFHPRQTNFCYRCLQQVFRKRRRAWRRPLRTRSK